MADRSVDLTLAGSPPKLGLGLWNQPWVEVPLELAFAFAGLAYFIRRTDAATRAGKWSPWVLAAAMAALQAINWLTPQPPEASTAPPATGWLGLFAYALLATIAWWMARTRTIRAA